MKKLFLTFILLITLFIQNVYADTNQERKAALLVKATYDIVDNQGTKYIRFSIFNITENLYVEVQKNGSSTESFKVTYDDLTDGIYYFDDYNITDIYKYRLKVYSVTGTNSLREFEITKPRYNDLFNNPECKYEKTASLMYCQEWVSTSFNGSDLEILNRIKKIRQDEQTTTTKKVEEVETTKKRILNKKIIKLCALLLIGSIADIVFIIAYSIRKKKESEFL